MNREEAHEALRAKTTAQMAEDKLNQTSDTGVALLPPPPPAPNLAPVEIGDAEEFAWTDERNECLEMVLAGIPKVQIARDLKVHRNTINNWCKHPAFVEEAQKRNRELAASVTQRRFREVTNFADVSAKQTRDAFKILERDPQDPYAAARARQWGAEFRTFVMMERNILGIDAKTVNVNHSGGVDINGEPVGQRKVQKTSTESFRKLLLEALAGTTTPIDAELVDTSDGETAIVDLATEVLKNSDVLERIHEEDRLQAEEAMKEAALNGD